MKRGVEPREQTAIATAAVDQAEQLIAAGRPSDGRALLQACLEIQEAAFPGGCWRVAETRSLLGAALTALREFEQSEPLLLAAHADLVDDPHAPVEQTQRALTRIVALYQSWNTPQQVQEWRARR